MNARSSVKNRNHRKVINVQRLSSHSIFLMTLELKSIKSHFPIFTHRPELVYLDNAATSQKPQSVVKAVTDFYERENANVHRGLYDLSSIATKRYEEVRKKVSDLIGAKNAEAIAFTKGTTESINIVAHSILKKNLKKGDGVVITAMEHHANLIPWQQICKQTGATLATLPVNVNGELMNRFEQQGMFCGDICSV